MKRVEPGLFHFMSHIADRALHKLVSFVARFLQARTILCGESWSEREWKEQRF